MRLVGTTTWDQTDWTMEMSLCLGTCPDSGEEYCADEATGGTVSTTLLASPLGSETFRAGERWFAHLSMQDGASAADSTGYSMDVLACTTLE